MDNQILKHLNAQQCSVQWKAFLGAFAQELASQLTASNLRGLLRRTGEQFAQQQPLPETDTVAALQDAINAVWHAQNWGWASITEESSHLVIKHYLSPLQTGLLPENLAWSAGFLEGVYEQWLKQSGAGDELRLSQSGPADDLGTVEYRFGK